MRSLIRIALVCAAALLTGPAPAQDLGSQPVTVLCAFPAGSGADATLRALATTSGCCRYTF